jgi:hypothetical protein
VQSMNHRHTFAPFLLPPLLCLVDAPSALFLPALRPVDPRPELAVVATTDGNSSTATGYSICIRARRVVGGKGVADSAVAGVVAATCTARTDLSARAKFS